MKSVVIGAGRMGLVHVQALKELNITVAGVCDSEAGKLNDIALRLDMEKCKFYSNAELMLQEIKPELAIIATTAVSHHQLIMDAIRHGVKYILCEKPMAVSIRQCDEIIKQCKENNVHLAINHSGRFRGNYSIVKDMIDSAEFGGLKSMMVIGGNGGLVMNGSHILDTFMSLAEDDVHYVTAWLDNVPFDNPRGQCFEDKSGCIKAVTKKGCRIYIDMSHDQGHGINITYYCRYGWITEDLINGKIISSHRDSKDMSLPMSCYSTPGIKQKKVLPKADVLLPAKKMLASLIHKQGYVDGHSARKAILPLIAAYVSNENNHKVVLVDQTLPADRVFQWA